MSASARRPLATNDELRHMLELVITHGQVTTTAPDRQQALEVFERAQALLDRTKEGPSTPLRYFRSKRGLWHEQDCLAYDLTCTCKPPFPKATLSSTESPVARRRCSKCGSEEGARHRSTCPASPFQIVGEIMVGGGKFTSLGGRKTWL